MEFKTSNFVLASHLILRGIPLLRLEYNRSGKTVYVFEHTDDLPGLIANFCFDETKNQ